MSTVKDVQREQREMERTGWDVAFEKESKGSALRDSSSGTERASEDTVDRMKV